MNGPAAAGDEGQRERLMTVVNVRARGDDAEVMFAESARIYRLRRSAQDYEDILRKLWRAVGSGRPVRVRFDQPNGEIIERVD
jgi:hypothetical protein